MNESAKKASEIRRETLLENLNKRFTGDGFASSLRLGELTLVVPRERIVEVAGELRDNEAFQFEQLIDICGVDYSQYGRSEWTTDTASFTGFGRGWGRCRVVRRRCSVSQSSTICFPSASING